VVSGREKIQHPETSIQHRASGPYLQPKVVTDENEIPYMGRFKRLTVPHGSLYNKPSFFVRLWVFPGFTGIGGIKSDAGKYSTGRAHRLCKKAVWTLDSPGFYNPGCVCAGGHVYQLQKA
jgi:hypothetical protein